ncbi:hypothetical protein [Psychroserpens sp. S379A]|uniref:hypothetical protein n=1 Tax=Psychroserpens sp. S379A TaxID=3415137 RepID=UPI003C79F0D9
MKHLTITLAVFFFSSSMLSQDLNIETKSISIDNLIPFIVEHIKVKSESDNLKRDNFVFLLQTPTNDLVTEDKVLLSQAFKLVSNRLSETDYISILTYSGFNGVALHQTSPKELKTIMYTIDNLKSSVKTFHDDGIELAYNYASENFMDDAVNTVIMVRNSKALQTEQLADKNTKPVKKRNSAVLVTAIALLPELISVIKD